MTSSVQMLRKQNGRRNLSNSHVCVILLAGRSCYLDYGLWLMFCLGCSACGLHR